MNKNKVIEAFAFVTFIVCVIFVYRCPFLYITGYPCPGCGITRACIMAFHNIKQAFIIHPLFIIVYLYPIYYFTIRKKYKKADKWVTIVITAVFITVYTVRMALYFPGAPPLEYNENNLIKLLGGIFR